MSKQMLRLDVRCPFCHGALTEGQRVHLQAYLRDSGQDGPLYLSAIFGDAGIETDLEIADRATAEFRCPVCEMSLMIQTPCRLCRAPMASLNLASGGVLEFCSRRGCRGHALGGFGDLDQMMALVNQMMNTPHD